jgi:integrase
VTLWPLCPRASTLPLRGAKTKEPIKKPDTFATIVEGLPAPRAGDEGPGTALHRGDPSQLHEPCPAALGRERALAEIVRKDVIAMLDDVAENGTERKVDGKKVHAMGGPIAANRVLAAVRALCNWGIRRGLVEVNPCALVDRPGNEAPRERTLTAEEVKELWPHFESLGCPFGAFFQICLITGQRRTEVAEMRWVDVSLKAKTWTIPADQNKSGRTHVVPLPSMAVDILTDLPRKTLTEKKGSTKPSPFVFTSDGDVPIIGFSRAKERVGEKVLAARQKATPEAEDMADWGIHDLRRTAATGMGRLGIAEFIISKLLNHAARGVTGRVYNTYEYLTEKRYALDTWATYLTRLLQPAEVNVVALRA